MAKRFDGVKREEWHKRLKKFDGSGLTVAEFCRCAGPTYLRNLVFRAIEQLENGKSETKITAGIPE